LNKRDLPNVATVEEMKTALDPHHRYEHVESIASGGMGVFETLKMISKLTLRTLRRRMTGDESRPQPPARVAQFRVQDNSVTPPSPARTIAATTPIPIVTSTPIATPVIESPPFDEVEELSAEEMLPAVDRNIITDAPVVDHAPEPEPEPEAEPEPPPVAAAPEPEIDFNRSEKSQKVEPEVKTVKVRSSVDVMAELEALRKRATASTPKTPKRDALADLAALRPKRSIQRTLNLQIPADVMARAKSVRVTLSFEDNGASMVESREQKVELGDTADVQSVSVNLKIESA
jgi:hypothetical protein